MDHYIIKMQTPLDKYNSDLLDEEFSADPAQKAAVMQLQKSYENLIDQ